MEGTVFDAFLQFLGEIGPVNLTQSFYLTECQGLLSFCQIATGQGKIIIPQNPVISPDVNSLLNGLFRERIAPRLKGSQSQAIISLLRPGIDRDRTGPIPHGRVPVSSFFKIFRQGPVGLRAAGMLKRRALQIASGALSFSRPEKFLAPAQKDLAVFRTSPEMPAQKKRKKSQKHEAQKKKFGTGKGWEHLRKQPHGEDLPV